MPLTYQPFAEVPQVQKLEKDLRMNVPDSERVASAVAGAALVASALSRGGMAGLLLLGAGAALVRRGWLGHCPYYAHLKVDKRHHRAA